jgi:hypothetical protein
MRKKDIWISVAIIAAAVLTLCLYLLVKGSVKIDAGGATAVMRLSSIWLSKTTITSGPEPCPVGARVHRPERLSISMEQDGHHWQIDSRGPWGNFSKIRVKNNQTTSLKLGPPFLIRPIVDERGSHLSIDFAVIGQAGERYRNFVRKDDQPIADAELKIVDEAGNVLETGEFECG